MYDFTFKGINSKDLGITVNRRPPRESANTRSTITEIDGVDGGYIEKVGLNTYVMEFDMTVEGLHNVEKISGWLQGQGEFRRSDVPGKALWVEHQAPLEFEYLTDELYTCTTTFYVVDPTWYLVEDDWHEPWGKNLIPNGWDSFQPYGSGKIVFESDFTDMWNDQFINDATGKQIDNGVIEKTNDVGRYDIWKRIDGIEDSRAFVTVKIRTKTSGKFQISFGTGEKPREVELINDNTFQTYYFETPDIGNNNLLLSFFEKGVYELKELKVSNNNDRHLVVEKTPLENGLTRIQTWGGSNIIKLTTVSVKRSENRLYSKYVKTIKPFNIWDMWSQYSTPVPIGYEGIIEYKLDSRAATTVLRANNPADSLDFIASDPQIVEGDKSPTWKADSNPRIVNEGNYKSLPIIKIEYGTSKYVDVLINKTRFVYEFKDNDKYVIIDCENQTAVDEQGRNRIRNLKIGYEFPTLRPGPNTVKIIDGDAKISFRRKDRWR